MGLLGQISGEFFKTPTSAWIFSCTNIPFGAGAGELPPHEKDRTSGRYGPFFQAELCNYCFTNALITGLPGVSILTWYIPAGRLPT